MSSPHWQAAASWPGCYSLSVRRRQHRPPARLLTLLLLPCPAASVQKHPELQLFCNDWTYVRYLHARWVVHGAALVSRTSSRADRPLIGARSRGLLLRPHTGQSSCTLSLAGPAQQDARPRAAGSSNMISARLGGVVPGKAGRQQIGFCPTVAGRDTCRRMSAAWIAAQVL
jgi:hypothetical protein